MFIVLFTYKKPLEIVDQFLPQHVAFLEQGYQGNYFIASGKKIPRSGAVILSRLKSREQLEEMIKQHPFIINDIADFEIIEFLPCDYQPGFEKFI